MNIKRNRVISGLLSFAMIFTLVFAVLPPIEGMAAAPTITTEAAYDIELYEASVSAYVHTNGGNLFKEHGFYYGTTTSCSTKVVVDDNGGSGTSLDTPNRYTYTFDDLKMGTKYYYKAYVLTTSGTYYYGGVGNFTTEMLEYDISVETIDTDGDQTMNTIEMAAELYVDVNYGKASAITVGFERGQVGSTTKKTTDVRGYYDGDEFGWSLTDLSPGTSYRYRGFAIDPMTQEYIYGDWVTITTLDEEDFLPEVYTDSATDITLTSAVINGELDFTADLSTEYGFILGTGTTEQVKIGTTTKVKSFEYEWEDLLPNTKYTYKTYAKNKYGTVYGATKTFTTKIDATKPVIEVLKSSLGNEFTYGSTVSFTAEASDNIALYEFILYVDNVEVDYSDYWTDYEELEYTTNKLSVGSHTIKAYAVDDAGNEATKTLTIVVTEPQAPVVSATLPSKVTLGDVITISGSITSSDSPIDIVSVEVNNPDGTWGYYPFRQTSVGTSSFSLDSISTKSYDGTVTSGGIETGCVSAGYVGTNYDYYSSAFDFSEPGSYLIAIRAQNEYGIIGESIHTVEVVEPVGTGILGDVNSDGRVTNLDSYIWDIYLKGGNVSLNTVGADINRNGIIDNDDYTLLSKHLSQMSGYEDLYVFSNTTQAKPVLTGIQDRYTVKKGESLNLSFSVSALSGGLVEKITLKHNLTGTTFAPISYTTNKGTYSNVFNISGYPLNTIGTYDFIVYCRANNYTITDNAIYRFTVDVIDSTCTHPTEAINDIYKSTVYDSAVNSSSTHTYHHTYTRKCTNCGTILGTVNSESFTESHSINKKGYCLCGYIDNSGYSSWSAYNTSAGKTIVYRNPESTGYYGEIYADESVTVVGECCDRYLIKYSVSGGTKMGYVNKDALYRTFTFNGNTIKLYDVIGTTRLYANTSELMSQMHGMYDRTSDDTATLIYYRTNSTDSALVINVDLSQAEDWDGITFSVKGIDNQIIGYILTTKLNGEHYIDVNKFLEYASISSYNQEKSSNEQQLLHLTLIRDYDEITFSEDAFDSDSVMKKILYKGGIGAIIDGVQNIMDLSSGGVVNGTDIMDTMVINMISSEQDSLIDMAIECTEALDTIKGVYEKINTANSGVSPLMPQKFSYFLEELSAMSDTEFNSMLGSQIIGEASNNKELSAFLSRYGLSIENFPIDKVGNIRKAVKLLETLDTINKIITPLLDGTNRYLTHKKISDNFKGDIKDQLLLLKNTATDQRVKNTIQTYITNIESGNYDSIFNVSEAWAAAGYTVEYLASNKDIIKNAYNFTYKLSQNGFFGSKIASAAAKMNGSEFMGIVKGVASADTLLSAPSTIMGIVGYDCSSAYDIEVNLVTVSSALRDTRNKFASATFGTKEYSDYFTACNLWVDKLISLVNDYCNCFPDDITGDLKTEIDKYQAIHTNNRARMQSLIN